LPEGIDKATLEDVFHQFAKTPAPRPHP